MNISVGDLARALEGEAVGDTSILVRGAAEPGDAGPEEIAIALSKEFLEALPQGRARVALLPRDADWRALGLDAAVLAPGGRYVMAGVTRTFEQSAEVEPGVHPTAIVHPEAMLGPDVSIGPFAVIGARVRLGPRARIHAHVTIAEDVQIGADALLHAGARICARVTIGDRFIAHSGAVIGADGFSFVTPKPGVVDEARASGAISAEEQQAYVRINSLGSVRIGDDVEIGANSCIDRGTIADTTIGDGTKIDNLVQIGHNVRIGRTCLLCGQSGVAGSAEIGDQVVIGGKASIADHLRIGSNVVITGNSGVASHVAANQIMMGYPAVRMDQNVEMYKALRRLPRLLKTILADKKAVPNPERSD